MPDNLSKNDVLPKVRNINETENGVKDKKIPIEIDCMILNIQMYITHDI